MFRDGRSGGFSVPDDDYSSEPPSTPDRNRQSQNAPSTTPAGPPPGRSFFSSTPAGPPPNSLFGGASRPQFEPRRYNSQPLFGSSPPKDGGILEGIGSGSFRASMEGRPGSARRTLSAGFNRLNNSPPKLTHEVQVEDEDADQDDAEGDEDDDMDVSDHEAPSAAQQRPISRRGFSNSFASQSSIEDYHPERIVVHPGAKQQQHDLLSLAKGLSPSTVVVKMNESDDIILETERLMESMYEALDGCAPGSKNEVLGDVAQDLLSLWRTASSPALSPPTQLAELLLGIHHPYRSVPKEHTLLASRAHAQHGSEPFSPIPKVLLDWINARQPLDEEVSNVMNETDGFSKSPYFWDMVQATAVRGQFRTTLDLLNGANFAVARTAKDDMDDDAEGYVGHHLDYATRATQEAVRLLRECPALVSDDWDVMGPDWKIFRQRAYQAMRDLEEFAEGESRSRFSMSRSLGMSSFGLSQNPGNFNLSTASRRVECKVPWTVYEALIKLYRLLLGDEEEILLWTETWIEATLCLTIWWNGEDDVFMQGSLAARRRSLARSHRSHTTDIKAYCGRLAAAFCAVIEGGDELFSVNPADQYEVGLACILDDNVEGVLQILRGYSLVISSAVAEVASLGEWLKSSDGVLGGFDESDLLLLSYPQPSATGLSKDELLVAYAKQLAPKGQLMSADGTTSREGWELAIELLGRLHDTALANQRIQRILDDLPLRSSEQVDKVIQLCNNMGLSDQALGIALKYAEHLHASTQNYGDAIMYYARAHAGAKIQEVLRVLIAHCLVKSAAYPPVAELDASLRELITSPKKALTKLASLDSEAAELLSNSLSGYATIRKFYDLRDEETSLKDGEKPAHRPMSRRRTAASALIVIISSAASSIRGGLYDPNVETVVQVDVLLPLLGEALVFVNQPKRTLTIRHLYDLLAAVEDISTAPGMIRTQCEEALRTTLAAAHENSPNPSFHKSASNLTTASSQFSLIGSMDLGSVEGVSTESSMVLVKGGGVDDMKRGWDWRKGFPRGAKGDDIIRILRLGIAKELGRAFAEGEVQP